MASSSGLPVLPRGGGGGGSGSRPDVVNLFRAYEGWLNGIKPGLGKNSRVMARNPVATLEGIRFEICNTGESTVDSLLALQGFCPGCKAKGTYDDEADKNVVFVTVPWPADHRDIYDANSAPASAGWRAILPWGWMNEPKILIGGIILSIASASYTTHWVQWRSLAATLAGAAGM